MNEDTPTKAEILALLTEVERKIGARILALGGTRDLAIAERVDACYVEALLAALKAATC